ncbi:aminotransferase class I/II-fold pyridoxal phosphate-dependent enzyme [Actinomadura rudentiformis]|uniref:8-amino-7-oxononanoate synthase n=1 Tax=Actinomadura rudentiformis TaxID=359158 RepID=A0A6H9Y6U4_9ACTN|nr:aminotransferase class I/II-fold pyridoxal phosphate-dependent enzyme [Actinomadura rudentiformis]KAB2340154.1 aminotransferase class I/II-fold pyridoxal phosphate-dependent enzyme [Actinomadura rudentiformis]
MIPAALDAAAAALAGSAVPSGPLIQQSGPGRVHVDGRAMVNMASCDYLGLARHPHVLTAAHLAMEEWGLGSAAGRVLSGNTILHARLEERLAAWVGCQEAVLHGSCWTANAAIFAALAALTEQGNTRLAVFSDRLNHASIIDAIRAQRRAVARMVLYGHEDLDGLRHQLAQPADGTVKVIVTDGVFSMEGDLAPLADLCALAEEFEALLIVDDSHGTGVVGAGGHGTAEAHGVLGRVDVITGTLGKALGGAIGGFVAGARHLMTAVRTLSRPYVFSNNPPTAVVAGALAALDILESDPGPLTALRTRVRRLRDGITELGLPTHPGEHPIVPLIVGDEQQTHASAIAMVTADIYVTALTFPVVPRGQARLRLQVSATHSQTDIDRVLAALTQAPLTRPSG